MYGSFFTGFNTTASYVWIYWICVAALNLIALLMCPFHYKYCSHMDGLLQYCLQCLLLKHSCGLQAVHVGQKNCIGPCLISNFIWLLHIFLVSTPPLLCFLIYSCVSIDLMKVCKFMYWMIRLSWASLTFGIYCHV